MESSVRAPIALLAIAACLSVAATMSHAAEAEEAPSPTDSRSGFYVTAGVGRTDYRVASDVGMHDDKTGYGGKVMLGYQVVRSLRFEVGAVKLAPGWSTDPAVAVVGAWHLTEASR